MKSRLLASTGQKVWALVFSTGEEVAEGLLQFATEHQLGAGQFSAIGAFKEVELGFFEIEKKEYKRIGIREQVEVLSFLGDISLSEGKPKIHAHVVLGKSDGSAWGGHILKAIVRPTLEVILTESPTHLRREYDQASGLALINPELP
jgi:predicted DNA-binding protein with PD1-like motif